MKRFWNKVDRSGDCWEWTAGTNGEGYGKFWLNSRHVQAHRVSFELTKGQIPDGLVINHLCENPRCVRPSHLEAVTHRENLMYSNTQTRRNSLKTHCVHGHEFTDENTYIRATGHRDCRQCNNEQSLRRYHKKRQKLLDNQP